MLNHTKSQWVDLGIQTEACMTWPETCGAAGGAISVFVNVIECPGLTGIISSYAQNTSSQVMCTYDQIRYDLTIPYKTFSQMSNMSFWHSISCFRVEKQQTKCVNQIMFWNLRLRVLIPDGRFKVNLPIQTGWTHIVLNYIGPNDGEGIRSYVNGQEVASETTKSRRSSLPGDGRIVVGRRSTDQDMYYTSVQIDELVFFNKTLSTTEITAMYNAV